MVVLRTSTLAILSGVIAVVQLGNCLPRSHVDPPDPVPIASVCFGSSKGLPQSKSSIHQIVSLPGLAILPRDP